MWSDCLDDGGHGCFAARALVQRQERLPFLAHGRPPVDELSVDALGCLEVLRPAQCLVSPTERFPTCGAGRLLFFELRAYLPCVAPQILVQLGGRLVGVFHPGQFGNESRGEHRFASVCEPVLQSANHQIAASASTKRAFERPSLFVAAKRHLERGLDEVVCVRLVTALLRNFAEIQIHLGTARRLSDALLGMVQDQQQRPVRLLGAVQVALFQGQASQLVENRRVLRMDLGRGIELG